MRLDDLPIVSIPPEGEFKFVQVGGPENSHYLFGTNKSFGLSHKASFYFGFLSSVQDSGLDVSDFECLGGGNLNVNSTARLLFAYGKSDMYGKFNVKIVKSLLENYVKSIEEFKLYSVRVI